MSATRGTCLFLGLPLEIRQQIYGYLLSTKSTKEYVLHKVPDIGGSDPTRISYRPGHRYCFQTAILRTNSQINKEAEHIFHNGNQFVSISHHYHLIKFFSDLPGVFEKYGIKDFFERRGFPILATEQSARDFRYCAMDVFLGQLPSVLNHVSLETWWHRGKRSSSEWKTRSTFVIASDDLQQLCRVILEVHQCYCGPNFRSQDYTVLIDIVNRGDQLGTCSKDGALPIDAKVQRLLEPFRRLYNVGNVIITGHVNEQYKSNIRTSMMKEPPTAQDMINTGCANKAKGDEAFRNKDFPSSISAYEKAYSGIEADYQLTTPFDIVAEGKYAGVQVSLARQHLLFTLLLGIVATLLELREYQNAYNWTSMEPCIHKHVLSNAEVAWIWYLKSQASRWLGQSETSYHQLVQAVSLHPDEEDMASELGNMIANVLKSSTATLKWASSSRD